MAAIYVILLSLGVSTINAVNVVRKENEQLVRREVEAVEMESSGHVHKAQEIPQALFKEQQQKGRKEEVVTECNRQFLLMDEGSDACTGSGAPATVMYEGDCKRAAKELSLQVAEDPNFFLDTHMVNPLPYPHGCYLNTTTNKVAFNPSESNDTSISGKKICMRSKYVDGTPNTNPTGDTPGCQGDAKPITTSEACWQAALCSAGGGACKLLDFAENRTNFTAEDKPQGCYKDGIGCWGFNNLKTAPTGPIVNGTAVCFNEVPSADTAAGF